MHVLVVCNYKTIHAEIEKDELVERLKEIVLDKEGIHPTQQSLTFNGTTLIDGHQIGEYGIDNESTVHLRIWYRIPFDIDIRQPDKVTRIQVLRCETFADIKLKIQEVLGFDVVRQTLLYNDAVKDDSEGFVELAFAEGVPEVVLRLGR